MGGNYRVTAAPSAANLRLAGELIVSCDGASRDGITLEARYVISLGRMFEAIRRDGNSYYDYAFDKEAQTLTYILTPYGIDASLEFSVNALVSNPLVYSLTRARLSHFERLARGDSDPTVIRQDLDHAQGAELIAHLVLLGVVSKLA